MVIRCTLARRMVGGLLAAVIVAGLSACSPQEPELPPLSEVTPSPVATATKPTSTLSIDEQLAFEDAEAALRRHVELLNALGHDPSNKKLLNQLNDTSNGQEFGFRNTLYRYDWGPKGIHLHGEGAAIVRRVRWIDARLDQDRPTVRLRVCLDSSDVVAVSKSGKRLTPANAPTMAHLTFTVMHDPDGRWRANTVKGKGAPSC